LSSQRSGLEVELPKFQLPATKMQWWAPERPNALERNRARAHQVAFTAMVAYGQLLKAFDYVRRGDTVMSARYRVPDKALGVGFGESSRGVILHHGVLSAGRFSNYQINGPLHWLASPRDDFGLPGPLEAAVMHTPLLEECTRPEDLTGIDILRTIRSFDP
jgi:hydrogenase large subunit